MSDIEERRADPVEPALGGLFVLELGGAHAAVLAGMLLADNGARVVKVESAAGNPERARPGHHVWNRGKQSVLLDVALPSACAVFERLLARADVAIWDAYAQRGVNTIISDRQQLSRRYPRLVTCEVTGYPAEASRGDLTHASDALVWAYTGRCHDQTGWEPGPSHVVASMPSIAAALLVVQGVTAALLTRSAVDGGQHVWTSLAGAALAISGGVRNEHLAQDRGLSPAPRGSSPFYAAYACRDGAWVQIGCLHGGFVRRAIEVLDTDGSLRRLATDPGFGDGVVIRDAALRSAAYTAMEHALLRQDRATWLAALDGADVPAAPIQATEEFLDDPQARVNGLAEVLDPVVGRMLQAGPFIRLSATPSRIAAAAPLLGQHQDSILAEVGADG